MTRLWVLLVGLAAAALPLAAQSDSPRFEVASIKPSAGTDVNPLPRALPGGRLRAGYTTVEGMLWFVYDLRRYSIVGGPDWVRKDHFEVNAKAEADAPADQIKLMVGRPLGK